MINQENQASVEQHVRNKEAVIAELETASENSYIHQVFGSRSPLLRGLVGGDASDDKTAGLMNELLDMGVGEEEITAAIHAGAEKGAELFRPFS